MCSFCEEKRRKTCKVSREAFFMSMVVTPFFVSGTEHCFWSGLEKQHKRETGRQKLALSFFWDLVGGLFLSVCFAFFPVFICWYGEGCIYERGGKQEQQQQQQQQQQVSK
ncbi:hypothetical protein QBC41DRAFT_107283 [Cercophora samala]|uniref:Uncharacterized protein n=1 Tax=Cercophora samala TaxID=330535 RepID=A0AA39ZED9_9PEZI|nr:hypothetical protein QBC41DRAFT_107283 [Cercophora samala]